MKKQFLIAAVFIFYLSRSAYPQTLTITGYVFNEAGKPEPGIVVVVNAGRGTTDKDGKFTIDFRSPIKPGIGITVSLENHEWAVLTPFMGADTMQNEELSSNPLQISIARAGSALFLETIQLSKLSASMQVAAMSLPIGKMNKSEIEAAREREKNRVFAAYANWSGVKPDLLRAAIEEWSRLTSGQGNREEAATVYLNREFSKSGSLYLLSARNKAAMKKSEQDERTTYENYISDYVRSGEGYLEAFQFKEALASFEELEKEYFETGKFSKETFKNEWLGLKSFIARTKVQLSYQVNQEEGQKLIKSAIDDLKQALNSIRRDEFMERQAQLEFDLGFSQAELAHRSNSKESISSLILAVAAFQEAANSGERLQRMGYADWGVYIPQISVGNTLTTLGEKTVGKQSADYLEQAVAAFDKADKLINRNDLSNLATLKLDQGHAFSVLATKTSNRVKAKDYVDKAAIAYEEQVRTLNAILDPKNQCSPCSSASMLISLAIALTQLGEKSNDREKILDDFNKSVEALTKAGTLIKPADDLLTWSSLKSNLGRAYNDLAEYFKTSDPTQTQGYLEKAAAAYEAASTVEDQGPCSPCAASTFISLGVARMQLAEGLTDLSSSTELLKKAGVAFDKADGLIKQDDDLMTWASLKSNSGQTLSDLGYRTADPVKSQEYFDKAVLRYEAAYRAYTVENQDPCPPCAISTLVGLGIARMALGERVCDSASSLDHLNKALTAFDSAEKLIEPNDNLGLGSLKVNLGQTFSDLGEFFKTTEPKKSDVYIHKAVAAYEEAAQRYSLKDSSQEWTDVKLRLASAYCLLKDWKAVVEAADSVSKAFPDDYRPYGIKLGIEHDARFDYQSAFMQNKEWLDRHPNDLIAQFDFAEKHFTTGRFEEAIQLINRLLSNSDSPVEVKVALQAIEIACLLASSKPDEVLAKLDVVIAEISDQPCSFKVSWIFNGSRHFIGQDERLAPFRIWMDALLGSLSLDHGSMVKAVKDLRMNFKRQVPFN
jgi:hypothetical protein